MRLGPAPAVQYSFSAARGRCLVARGERAPRERLTHRNGYRIRSWQTRARDIESATPKLRRGSYFLWYPEPRRRGEQALVSVVHDAHAG